MNRLPLPDSAAQKKTASQGAQPERSFRKNQKNSANLDLSRLSDALSCREFHDFFFWFGLVARARTAKLSIRDLSAVLLLMGDVSGERAYSDDKFMQMLQAWWNRCWPPKSEPTKSRPPQIAARHASEMSSWHLGPVPGDELVIHGRRFPIRMRADLQRSLDQMVSEDWEVRFFSGLTQQYEHSGYQLQHAILPQCNDPLLCSPPKYETVDIGHGESVEVIRTGFWAIQTPDGPLVMMVSSASRYSDSPGIKVEIAAGPAEAIQQRIRQFFKQLEKDVQNSKCYRGKILSLNVEDRYSGESTGLRVHQLKPVRRDEIVLPEKTIEQLDRNLVRFVEQRAELKKRGLSPRKGVLFYGPPGTGKTHTLHYLAAALPHHTTLLMTAEQIGALDEYMTLARLLQPALIVIEDADLIARDRESHDGCSEVYLNKLLNHMDGLKEDAELLFILTTNRPSSLEPALANRPGRIDQAIEFPLPDEEGRQKLIRMYAGNLQISLELQQRIVSRTQGVSAAFIKELLRRSFQYQLEQSSPDELTQTSVEMALDEMLSRGGPLNLKLLGADQIEPT